VQSFQFKLGLPFERRDGFFGSSPAAGCGTVGVANRARGTEAAFQKTHPFSQKEDPRFNPDIKLCTKEESPFPKEGVLS